MKLKPGKIFFIFLIVHCSLATDICLSQWIQVNNGMGTNTVLSLTYRGNNIFAGTFGWGVYLSTNNGANWIQTSLIHVPALAANENIVIAGTWGYGLYLSTDNGANWTQTSLNNSFVVSLAIREINIFAGTPNGVYLSVNNGTNWAQTSLNNRTVNSLAISGNNIFAGTEGQGIYRSTDNGTSWIQTSLNYLNIKALAVNGNNLFAGASSKYGVWLSTNNGITWAPTSLNMETVYALAVNGNNIFAGIAGGGVYVSTNNGANWIQRNEGLGNITVRTFCIFNNYIFAGTENSVYRRPLNELVGVQPISNVTPKEFSLSQNYPNPFNPTTKIRFDIPPLVYDSFESKTRGEGDRGRMVRITIYDILGKEAATLVNGQLRPGTYEVEWDASNYPSGVYYFKLFAGEYSATKKMVLLR